MRYIQGQIELLETIKDTNSKYYLNEFAVLNNLYRHGSIGHDNSSYQIYGVFP